MTGQHASESGGFAHVSDAPGESVPLSTLIERALSYLTIDPETDVLDGCLAPHRCHDAALRIEHYLDEFGFHFGARVSTAPDLGLGGEAQADSVATLARPQEPSNEPQMCSGEARCGAPLHVHGCYADHGNCDAPDEHGNPTKDAQ